MTCEILSIGTELLMGQIANTDAKYLCERLSSLGVSVYHITTVGDNAGRVKEALTQALGRSDMVITTGGLGPTEDDLTKGAVAECLGCEMVTDERTAQLLREHAAARGYQLDESSLQQARFPKGARIMPNRRGTAPGFILTREGKTVAVLPGPPHELTDMFEQQLQPVLMMMQDSRIASRFLHIFGMGEPQVQQALSDLFQSDNPTLALYCGVGVVTARITASGSVSGKSEKMLDPLECEIRKRLGSAVFAEGRGVTLAEAVVKLLAQRGKALALSESCTGGMLASQLVDCAGASKVLLEGHVTYTEKAKMRVLGVSKATLDTYGAYSAECASEMAAGTLLISSADYALSVTGIAGPDGGTPEKPVGTCFIGLADRSGVTTAKLFFDRGDRRWIRQMCCQHALNLLRMKLIE